MKIMDDSWKVLRGHGWLSQGWQDEGKDRERWGINIEDKKSVTKKIAEQKKKYVAKEKKKKGWRFSQPAEPSEIYFRASQDKW